MAIGGSRVSWRTWGGRRHVRPARDGQYPIGNLTDLSNSEHSSASQNRTLTDVARPHDPRPPGGPLWKARRPERPAPAGIKDGRKELSNCPISLRSRKDRRLDRPTTGDQRPSRRGMSGQWRIQ